MTKKEIIEETVNYYLTHHRGFDEDKRICKYVTDAGDMCAFGRCVTKEILVKISSFSGTVAEVLDSLGYGGDPITIVNEPLNEKYQGHDSGFWRALQHFHDTSHFWESTKTGNELTLFGENELKYLLATYTRKRFYILNTKME